MLNRNRLGFFARPLLPLDHAFGNRLANDDAQRHAEQIRIGQLHADPLITVVEQHGDAGLLQLSV